MLSWFFSLRGNARTGIAPRRALERYGFGPPRVPDNLLDATPGRLGAETAAKIIQKRRDLLIRHAVGKTRHDGAAFPCNRTNAGHNDVGGIARFRRAQRRRETKVDAVI